MNRSFKTKIIKILERILGREIARRTPTRGAELFANIDQIFGKKNFRVIFDVGANIGQSALVYRQEFPNAEIYSFEPVSSTFEQLQSNIRNVSGVQSFQLGFGSQASRVSINVGDNSELSSILHNVGSNSEIIEIQALDEFARQRDIEEIDFLKIDTEGYELEILRGADDLLKNQRIGMLYIEAELMRSNYHYLSIDELNEVLTSFGYQIFGIYEQQPGWWGGEHSIRYCNILYIAPKLISHHVSPDKYPLRTKNGH